VRGKVSELLVFSVSERKRSVGPEFLEEGSTAVAEFVSPTQAALLKISKGDRSEDRNLKDFFMKYAPFSGVSYVL
jgi:hypothetical protein